MREDDTHGSSAIDHGIDRNQALSRNEIGINENKKKWLHDDDQL